MAPDTPNMFMFLLQLWPQYILRAYHFFLTDRIRHRLRNGLIPRRIFLSLTLRQKWNFPGVTLRPDLARAADMPSFLLDWPYPDEMVISLAVETKTPQLPANQLAPHVQSFVSITHCDSGPLSSQHGFKVARCDRIAFIRGAPSRNICFLPHVRERRDQRSSVRSSNDTIDRTIAKDQFKYFQDDIKFSRCALGKPYIHKTGKKLWRDFHR